MTAAPSPITARAARARATNTPVSTKDLTSQTVLDYLIGPRDMEMIYMSPDPHGRTFEEPLDIQKFDISRHPTASLRFISTDGRLILASMDKSTPGARIDKWRSKLRGAWLVTIGDTPVSTLEQARSAF
jgi:hypothetical protein